MPIHPTAIIDPTAEIDASADIGPYCIIRPEVHIGARTRLMANNYLEGPTWVGEDNIFFPYSTPAAASQDLKYKAERAETRLRQPNGPAPPRVRYCGDRSAANLLPPAHPGEAPRRQGRGPHAGRGGALRRGGRSTEVRPPGRPARRGLMPPSKRLIAGKGRFPL